MWLLSITIWLVFALSSMQPTDAFTTASSPFVSGRPSTTSLEAASRRGVLGKLRQAILGSATVGAFRASPSVALVDETPVTTDGRIVELQVANLGGVEGKTGTVKIQLRPEWAPRGVKRFEVCSAIVEECSHASRSSVLMLCPLGSYRS